MISSRSGARAFVRSIGTNAHRETNSFPKVWLDFSKRPESLRIANPDIRTDVLSGINPLVGPSSIDLYDRKLAYISPLEIDETFQLAHDLLEKESAQIYLKIDTLSPSAVKERDQLLVDAEINNPEALFNVENLDPELIDKSVPVYRHLLEKKWREYDLMITMQRLETLHVIPDTLPTLDPEADVKVKFAHNLDPQFSDWVTPGDFLPAHAASQPPVIRVQEFGRLDESNPNLYTVVVVNPDTPNLDTNSFTTRLQYGLANVPLDNVNNTIDAHTLLSSGSELTFTEFEPLAPEVNAGDQRACLWVFRQEKHIEPHLALRENFDIRAFQKSHSLVPIGAHVWRQRFDRSVPLVRAEYGFPEARVFHRVRGTRPVVSLSDN